MSKPLSAYPVSQRLEVINRRLAQSDKGLGYWSAVAAKAIIDAQGKDKANG